MLVPLMNATFMPPLTPRSIRETTRKAASANPVAAVYDRRLRTQDVTNDGHRPPLQPLLISLWERACSRLRTLASLLAPTLLPLFLTALTFSGCATPGVNHLYLTAVADTAIHDLNPTAPTRLPRAVLPGERVLGLAYDYNTDHLFLRVTPAQTIRVIERPSGKILRTMPLPAELHTPAPADLAVRSADRHLFAVHPDGRSVIELTLHGAVVRRLELPPAPQPITGLAFDQRTGHLLALTGNVIHAYTADGQIVRTITLPAPVHSVSLAYDSDAGRFFVPLADGRTLGEFDATGALVQRHAVPSDTAITALDAGPRSLVRIF
jgi:hypothetical protein